MMNTNKILIGMLLAGLVVSGCQKDELQSLEDVHQNDSAELVAGEGQIVAKIPSAKTTYGEADENGNYPVVWAEGDAVKVYSADAASGSVYALTGTSGTSEALFTVAEGNSAVYGETRYAVYPAAMGGNLKTSTGELRINLAGLRNQDYHSTMADNASNISSYPLWAASTDDSFTFNNVCGAVLFQFNDYQGLQLSLQSLEIKSKNNFVSGYALLNPETGAVALVDTGKEGDVAKAISSSHPTSGRPIYNTTSNAAPSTTYSRTGFILALPAKTYAANDLTATITDTEGRVYSATIPVELNIRPGATTVLPVMNFTLYYGSANCVVLAPGESAQVDITPYYTFKSDMTYENRPVLNSEGTGYVPENLSVETIWELADGADAFADGSVLSSCSLNGTSINITANDNAGNAVVAIKSGETVIWSYHIWISEVYDNEYTYLEGHNPIFMDRNLGATATALGDRDSYGLFYEWGRKDPFAIKKTFTRAGETVTETNPTKYYTAGIELTGTLPRTATTSIATAIQNPSLRIYYDGTETDWYRSGGTEAFWGDCSQEITAFTGCEVSPSKKVKTVYDPCPAGYMVPSYYDYTVLSCGTGSDKNTNKSFTANQGYTVTFNGSDSATWPLTGYIVQVADTTAEGVYYLEYRSRYWSSSVSSDEKSLYFYFNQDGMGNSNKTASKFESLRTSKRTMACPIRCVKIQDAE